MEKHLYGAGDYVLMTEKAASHKLQIGKIIGEEYGSKSDSSFYYVVFGDEQVAKIPLSEFENVAKLLIGREKL